MRCEIITIVVASEHLCMLGHGRYSKSRCYLLLGRLRPYIPAPMNLIKTYPVCVHRWLVFKEYKNGDTGK